MATRERAADDTVGAPWRGWLALAVVFALALTANTFRNSFQFFVPSIEHDLASGRAGATAAMSVFVVVSGLCAPIAGRLVDRWAPPRVIAGGFALLGVALLTSASADDVPTFVVAFGVLGGAGFAGIIGAPTQVFVTSWFRRNRALAVALMSNAYSAGLLFLAPAWTTLAVGAGWRRAYGGLGLLMLVIAVPVALAALRMPRTTAPARPPGTRSLRAGARAAVTSRPVVALLFGLFACGITMGIVDAHLVPLLHDAGVDEGRIAGLLSVLGGTIVVGGLAAGWLSDRLGDRPRVVSGLFGLRVLALVLLALPGAGWRFAAFTVLFGLSYTGVVPIVVAALSESAATAGVTGAILGLGALMHQFGGFTGVLGAGLVRDLTGSYTVALVCAAAVAAAATVIVGATAVPPPGSGRSAIPFDGGNPQGA